MFNIYMAVMKMFTITCRQLSTGVQIE